jgi:competence protein ComEA
MTTRNDPGEFVSAIKLAGQGSRQPLCVAGHQSYMHLSSFRAVALLAVAFVSMSVIACSNQSNPDEIRQRTADATATVRRDAKAVAEGVKEGMGRDKTININKASREDLLTLPGMTDREADRIIAERPYDNAHDLVTRHVLPEAEFEKIRDRVIADR